MFILVHILWGFHWSFLENTFFTFYFSILKLFHNPLKNKSYKMFKHTQTIRRQKPSEEIISEASFISQMKEIVQRHLRMWRMKY